MCCTRVAREEAEMGTEYLNRKPIGHYAVLLFVGVTAGFLGQPNQLRAVDTKPYLRELRSEKLSKFILAFDIANGSDLAAAALSDLRVRIWHLDSGKVVHEFSFPEPETDQRLKLDKDVEPISVRFSPDGKTLAVSFLSRIYLYDVGTWQEQNSLGVAGEDDLRRDLDVTPATSQLKKRSAEEAQAERGKTEPNINEAMRGWALLRAKGDGRTRITDFTFTKGGSSILAAYCRGDCFAWPGHRWMASPTGSDPVRLWDLRSQRIVWERQYDPKGVLARVAPSPDGKRFAAVDARPGRCAVGIYDLDEGRPLFTHPLAGCSEPPSIAFLPEGLSFVTNRIEEGTRKNKLWRNLAVYETGTGKKIADFSRDEVWEVAISPDGRWLASTSWRGLRFQIWDVQAKKPIITKQPHKSNWRAPIDRVRFSPDGRWLVVGSDEMGDLIVYQFGSRWSEGTARN